MSRTIELRIDPETLAGIVVTAGSRELYAALGRLATWSISLRRVRITARLTDTGPELSAEYWGSWGSSVVVVAVWTNDHFTLHT